jgi:hypothetical protein
MVGMVQTIQVMMGCTFTRTEAYAYNIRSPSVYRQWFYAENMGLLVR